MEDVIPSAVSAASARLVHGSVQSSEAGVPALSPRPPESAVPARPPESAELAPALLTGLPQWQPIVLQMWQSQLDYRDDAQPPQSQL